MNMAKIKEKAQAQGIIPGKRNKVDLIRAIQSMEGNIPCFQTGLDFCDQINCCWRSDCLPASSPETTGAGKKMYLKKVKDELEEFKNKIDEFKNTTKKMVGKKNREAIDEISILEKKAEEEIKQKMHEISAASEEAWKNVKNGIDNSRDELKAALKKIFAKFDIKK